MLLAMGCTPRPRPVIQPPVIQQAPVPQEPALDRQPSKLTDTPKSEPNENRNRDIYECEREAAFASAGDKRRVFDNCMKTRGY